VLRAPNSVPKAKNPLKGAIEGKAKANFPRECHLCVFNCVCVRVELVPSVHILKGFYTNKPTFQLVI
jgi:hypothetical protein